MDATAELNTKSIKAGDTIYIGTSGSWSVSIRTAVADRVTPSGIVVVKAAGGYERRFNKDGYEMGTGSKWRVPFLVTKERYDAHMAEKAERDAHAAIRAAITATKDVPMADLCEALRKIQVMITTLETEKMLGSEK